jgi:hypothetical protein
MDAKKRPRGSYEFTSYNPWPLFFFFFYSLSGWISRVLCTRNKNEKQNEGDRREKVRGISKKRRVLFFLKKIKVVFVSETTLIETRLNP